LKEDYDYDLDPLAFFDNPTMKVFQKNDNSNEELIVQNAMDQVRIEQAQVTLNDRVLVTGGTGLVGSELIYQLLSKGKTVYCVVRARNDFEAYGRVVDKLKEI
ncbi:SDR family oxidoreductase, partial [Streptococcus pneumoniae]|nr:SDR family oxidoreductase [Streptococcus pneumoniae]